MIDQRNKNVSYGESMSSFFKGFVDFTGYSTRSGHWFPIGTFYLSFIVLICITFYSTYASSYSNLTALNFSRAYNNALNGIGFVIVILVVFLVLHIGITASFARRLRDVGFSNWGLSILITTAYLLSYFSVYFLSPVFNIIFFFVFMSLPSNVLVTHKNDELSKFFFRQSEEAKAYYSQFAPQNFNFPTNNGQFNPNNQGQNFNQNNAQFNPNNQGQNFNQNNTQFNPNNQGQNFNQNNTQFNPNNQGQNFNQNNTQFNPNNQGQNFNQNNPQFKPSVANGNFNPNAPHNNFNQTVKPNTSHAGFNGQPFTPGAQPGNGQNPNINAQNNRIYQGQSFNPNSQTTHSGQNFNFEQATHSASNINNGHSGQPTNPGAQPSGFQKVETPNTFVAPNNMVNEIKSAPEKEQPTDLPIEKKEETKVSRKANRLKKLSQNDEEIENFKRRNK